MSSLIFAVVGLKREARLLAGPNIHPVVGGGDPTALREKLGSALLKGRPGLVLSIGLGGGLHPELEPGDWVVADSIACAGGGWPTDGDCARRMADMLDGRIAGRVLVGPIAAGDAMVVDAASKAALRARTGALAVDMESHVAAHWAANHGLPFAALRVVSDGADRALPRAAQAGMKKDGGMDILAVLRELAKDPRQLPALIRTGREAEIAFARLKLLGRHDLLGRLRVGDADLGQLPLDVI